LQPEVCETVETCLHVVDAVGDVVETAAAAGEEAGDLGLGPGAAEQLDARLTHLEHHRFDAVAGDHLAVRGRGAGQSLICRDGDIEIGDRNPHMVDLGECARHRRPSIGSNTATPRSRRRTPC
jgi:hypothetical protein